jgi:transposase, IS30 family
MEAPAMSYRHFTPCERGILERLVRLGNTKQQIAAALGRHRGTIRRELLRNRDLDGEYKCAMASVFYWDRRRRCYVKSKLGDKVLMRNVETELAKDWSPEQIAGRWRMVDYAEDASQWISHESIYRHIRADKAAGGKLYLHPRRGHKRFSSKAKADCDMGRIKGRKGIDERPSSVNERIEAGHWEADTVKLKGKEGQCMATVVERSIGLLLGGRMPDSSAQAMNEALTRALAPVPEKLRRTVTVDNGKEFAWFAELETTLGIQVYFAHPYSAWERALNENTNGLLRQYFPKKKNLGTITDDEIQQAINALNNRPRKRLKYQTPLERYAQTIGALDT